MKLDFPNFDDPFFALLKNRKSCRNFSDQSLSTKIIAELLWAASGSVRPLKKMYTIPSAKNVHNIFIYLAMANGNYFYDRDQHQLQFLFAEDIRKFTGEQDFVQTAPLNLIFVANPIGELDHKIPFYEYEEVGHISQNIYLYCAYKNLATVVRGLIDSKSIANKLKLGHGQRVIMAQSVGHFAPR
jgi:nitroreductase